MHAYFDPSLIKPKQGNLHRECKLKYIFVSFTIYIHPLKKLKTPVVSHLTAGDDTIEANAH